ncbi:MAG: hypothetical protein FDZ69_10355 [Deltaproteobacteria bacterium]|nr:MAG: hypothetical protein FDZ69_10355 [Deltaproteobacteria bacterium]
MRVTARLLAVAAAAAVFGWIAGAGPAQALLASHDCSFCHDFHGSPSATGLLADVSAEAVCLTCHSGAGPGPAVAIHNPRGKSSGEQGYITCRECHNPHDNIDGNIMLVGYKYDPQNNRSFSAATMRVELTTSDPASPVYKPVTFAALTPPYDFNRDDGTGPCEICHPALNHSSSVGTNCNDCHSHATGFPKPQCTAAGCHDGLGTGAKKVGPNSPHSTNTIFASKGVSFTCGDCHGGHSGSAAIRVPNNPAIGIDYSTSGHNGIALRDPVLGTAASEAEVCWNCHANYGVSEWGTNTQPATGSSSYNYGTLSQPNWTAATWSSATFSYKTGAIQSTHAADDSAAAPGLDPVANLRCSYCHDVHELARAPGDAAAGKPYLRGTWRGNPYREDGAPTGAWNAYGSSAPPKWGAVPRGLNTTNTPGGYQIDQNNGNPTAGWTTTNSAGLCLLCHSRNKAGSTVTVDSMDWFGTNDWVGINGHSNAVIGGSGSSKFNVYSPATRAEGTAYNNPGMAYNNVTTFPTSDWMLGLRNLQGGSYSYVVGDTTTDNARGVTPPVYIGTTGNQRYTYKNTISWGVDFSTTAAQTQYHKFSCSKCHNPHASRLPRLMITNCLDVRRNTWDGNFLNDPDWTSGKTNADPFDFSASNIFRTEFRGTNDGQGLRNKQLAYAKSAQNCHRYVDVDGDRVMDTGDEPGWNKVTPW